MKKALIAIASLAIIFLACKKEEEPVPAAFWPFAEGNKWTTEESFQYEVTGVSSGSGSSTTSNEVGAFTEREDGKLVWPVTSIIEQGDSTLPTSITYYYVTEDSVYMYSLKDSDEPKVVEPNNLAVGVEWNGTLAIPIEIPNFPTDLDARYKVIATETVTDVPVSPINCLVIQIDIIQSGYEVDSAATQWRAEGMGTVKMATDFQTTYSLGTITFDVDIKGSSEMTSKNF